jgi:hypothetical protein
MNHMLHIAAATQVRLATEGRTVASASTVASTCGTEERDQARTAGPTTEASAPQARPGWRPCGA